MNTDLMPHKSVLFLISLSQNKIQEIGNKGVDYLLFMKTIRSYSHVEVHEAISEKLLSSASLYEVVVIVGHQLNGCIEMADGSLFPMSNIVSALPSTFSGYLHVAVCGSSVIWDAIKEHCVDSRVRASKGSTQLELQLLIYSLLLSRTDLNKDTFDYWYVFERDYIKELQKRRNPADLAKLPCATKLGEEKDIATSVFAPKEVKATYKFPIQVFLYFDSEKGTLVAKAKAEGVDPDTMPRLIQELLKNIHAGDMIDVRLTMLDKDKQPTHNILIFYQEGTFSIPVKIGEKETKVSFDVNITEQYLYEECWAQLSFINNSNNEKQCLNLEPFKIKIIITKDRSQGCDKSARIHSCVVAHGNRQTGVPRVDTRLAQTEDMEEPSREDIINQLLEWVNKGPWKSEKIAEDVKQMLLTILGQGKTILNDEESRLSCKLWDMLENGRGDRVKTTFQNIVGYLVEEGLLCKKSSPALNLDFFPEEKYWKNKTHDNINKGKSQYWYNNHRFEDVIPLLKAYCPKYE